jgi:hypothetical protein
VLCAFGAKGVTFSWPISLLRSALRLCRCLKKQSFWCQAGAKIPDDAWEYQIRKSLKDAAFQGLDYVPYCSTMPVPKDCDDPRFMWVSFATHFVRASTSPDPLHPFSMTCVIEMCRSTLQKKKGAK